MSRDRDSEGTKLPEAVAEQETSNGGLADQIAQYLLDHVKPDNGEHRDGEMLEDGRFATVVLANPNGVTSLEKIRQDSHAEVTLTIRFISPDGKPEDSTVEHILDHSLTGSKPRDLSDRYEMLQKYGKTLSVVADALCRKPPERAVASPGSEPPVIPISRRGHRWVDPVTRRK